MPNLNSKLQSLKKHEASGLAFSVAVVVYIVAALVFSFVTNNFTAEQRTTAPYFFVSFFLPVVMMLLSLVIVFKLTPFGFADFFGDFSVKPINIIPIILIFAGMFFGLNKVNDYFVLFLNKFGYNEPSTTLPEFSVFNYILCIFVVCLLPAVFEEALFRGVILEGIKAKGIEAALISAALFSIYHMSPAKTVYQLIAGFLFALIAIKTGSILPSAIIHFLNNFLVVTLNYFAPELFSNVGLSVWFMVFGLLSLAAGVVLLLVFNKEVKSEKDEKTADNRVIGRFFMYASVGILGCAVIWVSSVITSVI